MFARYWPAAYAEALFLKTMCKEWAEGSISAEDAWPDFAGQLGGEAFSADDSDSAQLFMDNVANPSPQLLQEMSEFLDYECSA